MNPLDHLRRGEGCVSDLALDRLVAREIEAVEADAIRAHAAGCAACRDRLLELEATCVHPLPALPRAARLATRRRRWLAVAVPAVALAAAILLFVMRDRGDQPEGGTRLKGRAHLSLFVSHDGELRPAASGEVVAPGDRLQFTYSSDRPIFLAVLSLDGGGHASIYFPDDDRRAWRGEPGADLPLPRSTILDEVLGREALVLLACDRAVDLAPLLAELDRAGTGWRFPPGCSSETIWIEKRP